MRLGEAPMPRTSLSQKMLRHRENTLFLRERAKWGRDPRLHGQWEGVAAPAKWRTACSHCLAFSLPTRPPRGPGEPVFSLPLHLLPSAERFGS